MDTGANAEMVRERTEREIREKLQENQREEKRRVRRTMEERVDVVGRDISELKGLVQEMAEKVEKLSVVVGRYRCTRGEIKSSTTIEDGSSQIWKVHGEIEEIGREEEKEG